MNIEEAGLNALSYDFGIQIARGTVSALATTVAGVIALTGTIAGLVNASEAMTNRINANTISMGGYANTLKAVTFAQQKVLQNGRFATDDILSGINAMNHAGKDAVKNYDLIAAAAAASNNDFKSIANIVRNGDYRGLAEMGVITDRMATRFEQMHYTQVQNVDNILRMLKAAKDKKMFDGAVESIQSLTRRIFAFKDLFVQSLLGDPKDPQGLAYVFKQHLKSIGDTLMKYQNRIIYWGKTVGLVLRTSLGVVMDFVKMIAKNVFHMDQLSKQTNQTMQDKLMSFGLWLEIQRVRIKMFFEEYGHAIGTIIKWFVYFKAAKFALSIGKSIIGTVLDYRRAILRTLKDVIFGFGAVNRAGIYSFDGIGRAAGSLWLGMKRGSLAFFGWFATAFAGFKGGIVLGFQTLWATITTSVTGLMASMQAWFASSVTGFLAMIGPIGWVVIGVAALAAGIAYLTYNYRQLIEEYNKNLESRIAKAMDTEATSIQNLAKRYEKLGMNIRDAMNAAIAFERQTISTERRKVEAEIAARTSKLGTNYNPGSMSSQSSQAIGNMLNKMTGRDAEMTKILALQKKVTELNAQSLAALNSGIASRNAGTITGADLYSVGVNNIAPDRSKQSNTDMKKTAQFYQASTQDVYPSSSYSGKPETGGGMGMGNNLTMAAGAITINVPAGSGIDEQKLAKMIDKLIKESMYKNNVREGK